MKAKDFFNLSLIRNKFDSGHLFAVRKYLESKGWISEDMLPGSVAAAMILLSMFETEQDLETFGRAALSANTEGTERESLLEGLGFMFEDPLNAATISNIKFNRATGRITSQFITGKKIVLAKMPFIATPAWASDGVITWNRNELISLASELQQDHHTGELVANPRSYFENFNDK